MTASSTFQERIKSERSAAKEDIGHYLCIPTMRLREAAETLKQFDANFTHYGHRIPIIIFSDADPYARVDKKNLRFPNYETDFAHLQNIARTCNNDVFIVTREDKDAFKAMLRERTGRAVNQRFRTLKVIF
ncbi:MAG TPA: hypothetical protein VFT64_07690 [Rickettsiales bacterium]|nr:hypothetical protein [Rickettsiales bacterium]